MALQVAAKNEVKPTISRGKTRHPKEDLRTQLGQRNSLRYLSKTGAQSREIPLDRDKND